MLTSGKYIGPASYFSTGFINIPNTNINKPSPTNNSIKIILVSTDTINDNEKTSQK